MASPASMQNIAARYLNNAMLFEQLRRCSAQAKGDSRFSDSREVKVLETLQQVQSFYDPKRSELMNEEVYEVIRKLIEYKLLVERAQPLSNRQVSSTSDGRDTHRSTLYRTRSLSPVNEGRETQYLGKKKSDEKEKHESVMPSQNILALSVPAELHSKEICSSSTGTRGEPDDSLIKAFPSVRAFQRIPKGMEATLSPLSIEGVSESSDATTVSSTESDSSSNVSLGNASSNSDRSVNRQNRTQVGPLSSHLTRSAPLKRNVVERQAKDEIKSDFTEWGRGFPTSLVNLSQVWDFVTLILVNRYLIPKNLSRRNCEIGDGVLQLYLEIKFGIAGFRAALQNFAKHHQNSEVDGLFVLLSNPSKSFGSQKNKRQFLIEATNPPFDTTSNAEEFCRLLAEYRYRYVTISFSKEEKKCIEVLLHTLLLSEFMRKE